MATQLYTGPITVSVSQTIKAVALAPGKTVSDELVAAYVIDGTILNVLSFGATGNGTTDDTVACQAAFTAAVAGDAVFFPAGTYLVDVLSFSASGILIYGVGNTSIIKKRTALSTNAPVISGVSVSNCAIQLLQIDGQGLSQSYWNPDPYTADGTVFADNIRFTGGSGNSIVNLYTHHAGSAGYRFLGSTGCIATNVTGDHNGFGTHVVYNNGVTGSDNFVLTGGSADTDYCDGCRVVGSASPTVNGLSSSRSGLLTTGASDGFAGCYFEKLSGGICENCYFSFNTNRGFDANDGSSDITLAVTNCVVNNNESCFHGKDGMLLGASGFTISGNLIYDNANMGIAVRGTNHTITGNRCLQRTIPQPYCLGIIGGETCSNITATGNDFRSFESGSIQAAVSSSSGFSGSNNSTAVARFGQQSLFKASLVGAIAGTDLANYVPVTGDLNAAFTGGSSTEKIRGATNGLGFVSHSVGGSAGTTYTVNSPIDSANFTISANIFVPASGSIDDYWIFEVGYTDVNNHLQFVVNVIDGGGGEMLVRISTYIGGVETDTSYEHFFSLILGGQNVFAIDVVGGYVGCTINGTFNNLSSLSEAQPFNLSNKQIGMSVYIPGTSDSPTELSNWFVNTPTVNVPGISQTVTPTASPAAGTYSSTQTVTLSDTDSGAKIWYTTDGSDPVIPSGVGPGFHLGLTGRRIGTSF